MIQNVDILLYNISFFHRLTFEHHMISIFEMIEYYITFNTLINVIPLYS